MALGELGTVTYNGFTFTSPYLKSKVSWTPVYDEAARVIKWWRVDIMLQTYLFTVHGLDTSVDPNMETLRALISFPGKVLVFQDVGLGETFKVGPGQVMVDCDHGPKPQEFTMETFGGQTNRITFRITTCLPEQCLVKERYATGKPVAASWEWNTTVRQGGWSTIQWNVVGEIPLALNADRTIEATADDLKERLTPVVLLGFDRETNWRLSADKKTLHGTITDTERPVPLPEGVAFLEVYHEAHSGLRGGGTLSGTPGAFQTWSHSVRGRANMPRNMTKADLWKRVHVVLGQLLSWARDATPAGAAPSPGAGLPPVQATGAGAGNSSPDGLLALAGGTIFGYVIAGSQSVSIPSAGVAAGVAAGIVSQGQAVTGRGVYLTDLRIGEQLFGDGIDFAMSYEQIGSSLHNILNDGGFFRPFPFASWDKWRTSMTGAGGAFDVRGCAQLAYAPSMEGTVIDLCTPPQSPGTQLIQEQQRIPPPNPEASNPPVPYGLDTIGIQNPQGPSLIPPLSTGTPGAQFVQPFNF